jgi:hypothetical protein
MMTIKAPTLAQTAEFFMWTGIGTNALALAATLLRHAENWALAASVQSAVLVACGVTAWRAHVLAAREAELTTQQTALTGRLVAERLMAEAMLRKMADAAMTIAVEDDDTTSRRH